MNPRAALDRRGSGAPTRFAPWWLLLPWLSLVAVSLAWNLQQAQQTRTRIAYETARSFFEQIVLARRWNARHGGVYVPVTPETPPNPYLKDPRRDLRVTDDLLLTKVNPAYMTRQLSELAQERDGVQFRIVSRQPVRPANAPVPWEDEALLAFERAGVKETGAFFVAADGREGYRYMAPLFIEQACLRCHEEHGYRLGDVRGGISVILPHVAPAPLPALVGSHVAIALAGGVPMLGLGLLLRRSHECLRQQASYDALTTLPNRRYFVERFVEEWRRGRRLGQPLSLIMCDIDRFKQYNDTFGHQAGDQCLRTVAAAIRDSLRRAGDFCARYGGEEFVVVLPDTPPADALRIAERIRAAVRARGIVHPGTPAGVVTLSQGVATAAETPAIDYETLLRHADAALYRAKEGGRDRIERHDSPRNVA